ncbi:MAG: hypothetical protein IPL33_14760 [Sphingobacteriales bacterium]|nr:hypothetical protein [Sphingobacteriales bacterium]
MSLCYLALNLVRRVHLLRSTKPSLCYFALNLMRSNFTCYEALNRPFAIPRLTWCVEICLLRITKPFFA